MSNLAQALAPTCLMSTVMRPKATTYTKPKTALPIIKTLSLQDFNCPSTRPQFLKEMRESLMEIGTFYIKDHGISGNMTQGAMKTVQDYFALPLEEKKKMLIGNSRHFRGYKLIGEEFTNNQVDHREQLQFGPEQSPIESFVPGCSPNHEGLQGPNQWPASTLALLPEFQPVILDFMAQLEALSHRLMEAVALSLGLNMSFFRDLFGQTPYYRLKCAKYPSVSKQATIGCGAHKDTGFLTVLLQDTVGGLQGQDPKTGQWMDTRPVPDTFIVTMGESMERLTDGLYHATVHRVLNNTSGHDRYSIPFFFDPALHAQIPARISGLDQATYPRYLHSGEDSSDSEDESSFLATKSRAEAQWDAMVESLDSPDLENTITREGWSNGDHVFETVYRCHPEVYSRWYNREF
ncbi:hypothetical protein BGZ52_004219 [Haplosporangium bisporale]|uniref:Fe2OG dioxygenase domain-containing protein n=1 Tax=Podila verticillata NRRL 6337 TaxID=1069443 RepID=A0A086TIW4_9FUNG|nr:hypothetical protein BGZ52_004219 [Haplosporangium bisporale]KFH61891.1 hypothetical protein MVEG_12225 [Podila verticillata NRRL 6337]